MKDHFQDDNEKIYDRQDGRLYKMRAKDAFTARMIKETSSFGETYRRWRDNREKTDAYNAGVWKPEPKPLEIDSKKVTYTVLLQLLSALVVTGCIFTGVWALALLTVPAFITLNIYFLIKDKD